MRVAQSTRRRHIADIQISRQQSFKFRMNRPLRTRTVGGVGATVRSCCLPD